MKHLLPLLDPRTVPSPCFVLDEARLAANAAILDSVQQRTGAKILLALKGFAAWDSFSLLSRAKGHGPLWGTCASSVDEARLGREEFGGEVHAFAAGWTEEELDELLPLVDHLVFNSLAQWERFGPKVPGQRPRDQLRPAHQSRTFRRRRGHLQSLLPGLPLGHPAAPAARKAAGRHLRPAFPHPVRTGLRRAGTHPGRRGGPFRQTAGPVQVDQFRRRPSHHPRRL